MRPLALLLLLIAPYSPAEEPVRVAVAANFKSTLEAISGEFSAETGYRVVLSAASTGVLSNQILHGAPFDIFFAADRDSPQHLAAAGVGEPPFCYALGQLALVGSKAGLAALARPELSLAVANPATAPYGRAALAVLARPSFQAAQNRKLVRGNNAVQAYQFWHSGTVDLALVPLSLVPDEVKDSLQVPVDWHQPLEQHAVLLRASPGGRALLAWLAKPGSQLQLQAAGYLPCP